jgi:hypothetical protein
MTQVERDVTRSLATRRNALSLALVAGVAACTAAPRGVPLDEGVRRLLTLSAQRAFARLFAPNGFYDAQVARLPALLGRVPGRWGAMVEAVMQTDAFRRRASQMLNRIAQDAAWRATPVVMDAIRGLPPGQAVAVLRGSPTAATDLLKMRAGPAVLDAMLPGISRGLRSDLAEMAGAALSAGTGVDYVELGQTLAAQAMDAMFAAIGREEAAIRADPRATRDPVLIDLLDPRRR